MPSSVPDLLLHGGEVLVGFRLPVGEEENNKAVRKAIPDVAAGCCENNGETKGVTSSLITGE